MKFKKILSTVLSVAMSLSLVASAFTVPQVKDSTIVSHAAVGLNVEVRSPYKIKKYLESHPFSKSSTTSYAVPPSTSEPYNIGVLSDETVSDGLNAINFMRYIAGLNEVEISPDYATCMQAASLVHSMNKVAAYEPSRPAGIPDDIYNLALEGSRNSNYCVGTNSLSYAVLLYIEDKGVSTLAHRRWCLNPSMAKTGFGMVNGYSNMYIKDQSRSGSERVAWPAPNMPTEYFNSSQTWSVTLNKSLSPSDIEVSLVRHSDSKVWKFSDSESDGTFYVDTKTYGQNGCISFKPSGISYNDGDSFTVIIYGAGDIVKYDVNFFSLANVPDEETEETTTTTTEETTTTTTEPTTTTTTTTETTTTTTEETTTTTEPTTTTTTTTETTTTWTTTWWTSTTWWTTTTRKPTIETTTTWRTTIIWTPETTTTTTTEETTTTTEETTTTTTEETTTTTEETTTTTTEETTTTTTEETTTTTEETTTTTTEETTTTTTEETTTTTEETTTTTEPTTTTTETTTTTTTTEPPATTTTPIKPNLGNVNWDNFVDASDASAVLEEYARLSTGGWQGFWGEQKENADVNEDGIVDATDASMILDYYSYASTVSDAKKMYDWLHS